MPRILITAGLPFLALLLVSCGGRAWNAGPASFSDLEEGRWFHRAPWRSGPAEQNPRPADPPEDPVKPVFVPVVPGPVPPGEWKIERFNPGPSSDTITLMHGERDFTVEDTIVQASARTAFIAYQGSGPYTGTTLRNCILRVEPRTLPNDRSYWAMRGYDMIDTLLERVEITGFGAHTRMHDEGHAIYLNVAGSLSVIGCDIHHNGGQGLQLVNRPTESNVPPGPAAGRIEIVNTHFRENAFNPDRRAFQLSIFGTGQPILMQDVEITAGLDGTDYPTGTTGGALLIEGESPNPNHGFRNSWWHPPEVGEDFVPPFVQGRTELIRVRIHHVKPDRPLVQIKGCEELIVRGCEFRGGSINLDDPTKAGPDCGRIVWEGNAGDAPVRHRGVMIGLASDDFVIESD